MLHLPLFSSLLFFSSFAGNGALLLLHSRSFPLILLKLLAILLALSKSANAQGCKDAEEAKTSKDFNKTCAFLLKSSENARRFPPPASIPLPPGTAGLPNNIVPMAAAGPAPIPATVFQCMDLGCLCSFMGGNGQPGSNQCTLQNGQQLTRSVRTEYRMLSDAQRQSYANAMQQLKSNGLFDQLAAIHRDAISSGSAHGGPAFLPWHREYIKRVEFALRMIDPSLFVPYWDSTLDGALPSPADSIMFTEQFLGATDSSGQVTNGPFAPWRTLEGNSFITRNVSADGRCLREKDIQWVLSQTNVTYVLAYSAPRRNCPSEYQAQNLEFNHGSPHLFIGRDMSNPFTAANDPIFYSHHAFIDLIWELWRQRQPSRQQLESQYPPDNIQCEPQQHFAGSTMLPFSPFNNIDGLRNAYTDNLFIYAPRPSCSSRRDCGSPYLFCDRSHRGSPRCASKVRNGGDCRGFTRGEQVCLGGTCRNGQCVATQRGNSGRGSEIRPDEIFYPQRRLHPRIYGEVKSPCYNEHVCCGVWAHENECKENANYMNIMCKASCKKCTPAYNLKDDCSNRHPNCELYASQGLCERYKNWMGENCRRSCDRCKESRAWSCTKGRMGHFERKSKTEISQCAHDKCYNGNICCQQWSRQGKCTSSAQWMRCNCPISCGLCLPRNVTYGACTDYNHKCGEWARSGQCAENEWMLENCRRSCDTCMDAENIENFCHNPEQHHREENARKKREDSSVFSSLLEHDEIAEEKMAIFQ